MLHYLHVHIEIMSSSQHWMSLLWIYIVYQIVEYRFNAFCLFGLLMGLIKTMHLWSGKFLINKIQYLLSRPVQLFKNQLEIALTYNTISKSSDQIREPLQPNVRNCCILCIMLGSQYFLFKKTTNNVYSTPAHSHPFELFGRK